MPTGVLLVSYRYAANLFTLTACLLFPSIFFLYRLFRLELSSDEVFLFKVVVHTLAQPSWLAEATAIDIARY